MELIVNGDTIAEAVTDELIARSIHSLTGEGDSFAILAQAPEIYMQTAGGPGDGFVLEYRNGSAQEHYSCSRVGLTADEVINAFQSYLAGDSSWKSSLDWQPQVFSSSRSSSGIGRGRILVGAIIVALIAWKLFFSGGE